jgi:hypothetical protein
LRVARATAPFRIRRQPWIGTNIFLSLSLSLSLSFSLFFFLSFKSREIKSRSRVPLTREEPPFDRCGDVVIRIDPFEIVTHEDVSELSRVRARGVKGGFEKGGNDAAASSISL